MRDGSALLIATTSEASSRRRRRQIVMGKLEWWLGRESNPRHRDFQFPDVCLHRVVSVFGSQGGLHSLNKYYYTASVAKVIEKSVNGRKKATMEIKGYRVRNKNGGWRCLVSWEDGFGKRHEKSFALAAGDEAAARLEAVDVYCEVRTGRRQIAAESEESLFEYSARYFKGRLERHEYERSTFSTNMKHMRAWERAVGDKPISKLTAADVKRTIAGWFDDGRDATTVDKRITALKEVYNSAVSDGLCGSSPLEKVRRPKKPYKELNGVNDSLQLAGVAEAIARLPLDEYKVAFSLALYTGMRRGEICALRWADVDLRGGVLWVRQAVGTDDGGNYVKPPKSNRPRDIAMPMQLIELLGAWEKKNGSGYVVSADGAMMNPDYITHAFTAFARFNGLEGAAGRRLTLHDLRHSAATFLIAGGADVKTVQAVLGHSSAAITLDMYASADRHAKESAARLLDSIRLNAPEGAEPYEGRERKQPMTKALPW